MLRDAALQRHAVKKFHGDEGFSVLLANIMNRANVGMVQRGRRLSFALKSGESQRVAGDVFGQELQGDKTMQPNILRFVDHAHAAAAESLNDAVVRDGLAEHERVLGLKLQDSGFDIKDV